MAPRRSHALLAVLMLAASPCSISYAEDVTLSSDPIGYWKFEASNGATVPDISGHRNNGIIFPPAAASLVQTSGIFAGTLPFAGDSDHFVQITPTSTLNSLRKQITVVALVYPTEFLRSPSLLSRGIRWLKRKWNLRVAYISQLTGLVFDGASFAPAPTGFAAIVQRQWRETRHPDQFYLGYGIENKIPHYKWHIGLMDGTDISLYCLPKGEERPQIEEWVQLAGTYDGMTGKMSLYVNGKIIGSLTHPGEIRLDAESMLRPIIVGAELNGASIDHGDGEFSGYIHDVRVYDRALSENEISILAKQATKGLRTQDQNDRLLR